MDKSIVCGFFGPPCMIKFLPYGENLVKIGPVDYEIICLKSLFVKEINTSRTYSRGAGMPRRLNNGTSKRRIYIAHVLLLYDVSCFEGI